MKTYKTYRKKVRKVANIAIAIVIGIVAVVVVFNVNNANANAITTTSTQDKAHQIANIGRDIGLNEDDPIITRAQEIWWTEENAKTSPSLTYLGNYKITGYDPYCKHCCGKTDGITASGVKAIIGETVAMKGVAFGTKIYIDGLGYYTVHDRGVGNGVVDVARDGHNACYAITGRYDVYIVE